jgi:hypothetical protein
LGGVSTPDTSTHCNSAQTPVRKLDVHRSSRIPSLRALKCGGGGTVGVSGPRSNEGFATVGNPPSLSTTTVHYHCSYCQNVDGIPSDISQGFFSFSSTSTDRVTPSALHPTLNSSVLRHLPNACEDWLAPLRLPRLPAIVHDGLVRTLLQPDKNPKSEMARLSRPGLGVIIDKPRPVPFHPPLFGRLPSKQGFSSQPREFRGSCLARRSSQAMTCIRNLQLCLSFS